MAFGGYRTFRRILTVMAVVGTSTLGTVAMASAAKAGTIRPEVATATGSTSANWTEDTAGELTPPVAGVAMAYDPAIGAMVEFGGFYISGGTPYESATTLLFNGQEWFQQPFSSPPPARDAASIAYDATTGDIVLFGGENGSGAALGDTWIYNGSSWVQDVNPGPPARSNASMTYDATTGDLVLFGGKNTSEVALGDTWTFNGSKWQEQSLSPAPPARYASAMAYDPLIGNVVLWGGSPSGGTSALNDTWEYAGSSWVQESPADSPTASSGAMDFDPVSGQIVLLNSSGVAPPVSETWTYDGTNWTEQSPGTEPPWRVSDALAWDPGIKRIVVLGGQEDYQAITYLGDTWLYGVPGSLTQTSNTVYDVTQGQIAFDLSLEGASVAVSGAAGAVTYTQSTGAAFVSVSSTGAISAVASTPPGDYFVSGTDADGAGDSGAWSFQLQVAAAPVLILPGGSVLPGSTVGDSYSQQFTAQLSQGPFTWSVTAGSLPTGLSLSSSGLLSGTTTKEGNYSFTITATASEGYGASVATSIAVAPASLTVDPSSLPGATSGDPYTTTLSLKGGGGLATPTFALASGGALPAGLVLSSTGVISGTPTSSGSSSFSIVATDGDGFSTTKGYSMLVEAPGASPITLSPGTLPQLNLGQDLNQALSASGGTAPYSYSITDGALPPGFTLASGRIYGISNGPESGQFTLTGTDADGQSDAVTYLLTVLSGGVTVSPTTSTLPTLVSSQNYQQAITASGGGGTGPYEFTITSGSLPQNMSLASDDSDVVTLEGGPDYFPFGEYEQVGTFTFTISAYDEDSGNTGSQTYTLTVLPAPDIIVNHTVAWSCTVGVLCSTQLTASGGTAPYTYTLQPGQPGLPAGFKLTAKGVVKGTATPSELSDDVYDVNLLVTDAHGFTGYLQNNFYVVVPHLKLTPSALPDPSVGQAYDQLVSASGGGTPYAYTVSAGALPAGINLNASNGAITGTPTTPGPASFSITATDANGYAKTVAYKVGVLGAPSFTSAPTAVVNLQATRIAVTTTGSYPAPLMTLAGALPPGLIFTAASNGTATITGKATVTGSFPVTITANNRAGSSTTETLTIWVYEAPLLPASKVFPPGQHSTFTMTAKIPADLITISGLPAWVSAAPGTGADQIVVSGTPPTGSTGTYPATVTIEGLAPSVAPPSFAVIVGT